jgi:hypothetical protein
MAKKIHNFAELAALSDTERYNWLISSQFDDQFPYIMKSAHGKPEAQDALNEMRSLRNALYAADRARYFRYAAIGLAASIGIAGIAGLTIASSGAFPAAAAFVSIVAPQVTTALSSVLIAVAASAPAWIPRVFRLFADLNE